MSPKGAASERCSVAPARDGERAPPLGYLRRPLGTTCERLGRRPPDARYPGKQAHCRCPRLSPGRPARSQLRSSRVSEAAADCGVPYIRKVVRLSEAGRWPPFRSSEGQGAGLSSCRRSPPSSKSGSLDLRSCSSPVAGVRLGVRRRSLVAREAVLPPWHRRAERRRSVRLAQPEALSSAIISAKPPSSASEAARSWPCRGSPARARRRRRRASPRRESERPASTALRRAQGRVGEQRRRRLDRAGQRGDAGRGTRPRCPAASSGAGRGEPFGHVLDPDRDRQRHPDSARRGERTPTASPSGTL